MKLQSTVGEVIVANTGAVSNFKINASAKSFSILSNSLYQNKIRAIIRELSCNALDSHVAAGTDRQFELHLPTFIEPYFSVTDYGLGMTPEQIVSVYTTYFESTKTSSNDFIGALGLGSKSPFSYTDAMVVTGNCNGISTVYSAFIDSSGIPCITQLNQCETDACNGLSIQFAVKEQDFSAFQSECVAVFQWWKREDLPIIHNMDKDIPNHREYCVDVMSDVKILPTYMPYVSYKTSVALMGNIAYPIDASHFDKKYLDILTSGLLIEFCIGELDFQPSREGLSYINYTKQNITQKLRSIVDHTIEHVASELDACDSIWERNAKIIEYSSKKLYLQATLSYIHAHDNHTVNHTLYSWNIRGINFPFRMDAYNIQVTPLKRTAYQNRGDGVITPTTNREYGFVVNSKGLKGAKTRSCLMWKEDRESKYIIEPIDDTKPIDLVGFKEHFKNPPDWMFIDFNELPKPAPKSRCYTKNPVTSIAVKRYSYSISNTETIRLDSTDTFFYLKCSGDVWDSPVGNCTSDKKLVRIAMACFKEITQVYKVNKMQYAHIKDKSNWIDLEVYLTEQVKRYESELPRLSSYAIGDTVPEIDHTLLKTRINRWDEFEARWFDLFDLPEYDYMDRVICLINMFGSDELKQKRLDSIAAMRDLLNQFYARYPMIQYASSSTTNSIFMGDAIMNYINLVDAQ